MFGQQTRRPEPTTPLIDVTAEAQKRLGETLTRDPDQPRALRLYIQGYG